MIFSCRNYRTDLYGLQGYALICFNRIPLKFGVPQGSKYTLSIQPLYCPFERGNAKEQSLWSKVSMWWAACAISLHFWEEKHTIHKLEKFICKISDSYMYDNKLCNNGDKSEHLLICNQHQFKKLHVSSINIENIAIGRMTHVRNSGVIFNKGMTKENKSTKCAKKLSMSKTLLKLLLIAWSPLFWTMITDSCTRLKQCLFPIYWTTELNWINVFCLWFNIPGVSHVPLQWFNWLPLLQSHCPLTQTLFASGNFPWQSWSAVHVEP